MTTSRQIYRPDPVQRPGRYPSASRIERLERMVLGMHGVGSTHVGLYPNGIAVKGGNGMDYSKFCFGFSISGPMVTIKWGEITWGKSTFTIGDTEIEITADQQYIGLECSYYAASVIGPSTDVNTFRSDDMTKRTWLYRFRFTAGLNGNPGSVTLDVVGKPVGNWDIGSEFSAP